ncbi:DoxX family protein [Caldimonas brevitalea]|uniref:DoxX family protein n=1 Tax=Caldimonas brevitalea TaxID=413882 RepID=A0A0G3BUJ4_9BURK|nr:DoxX family protein [Caldimonas brevitalea]AKJ30205.1 DoxX family protein [Caldimonas brevitalea]
MKIDPNTTLVVSTTASAAAPAAAPGWRGLHNRAASAVERLFHLDLLTLSSRVALAAIFFQSGRTKVEGGLTVSDNAIALFTDEYRLPLLPPEVGAHLAAYAEHLFPLLLVLGLGTRAAAAALLGMTLVIQVFVYPDAWPTHLSWATLAAVLLRFGGGAWSLDRVLRLR